MRIDGVNITGITCDSSKVKKGFAFVAIKGTEKDGNHYINDAIKRGANIIYTETDVNSDLVPVIKVQNSRKKLAELLNMYYDYPSKSLF